MLGNPEATALSHVATERGIDELRRQIGIIIQDNNKEFIAAYPVEFLTEAQLEALHLLPHTRMTLLFSGARAKFIGLPCEEAFAVQVDAQTLSLADMAAIADPLAPETTRPALLVTPSSDIHSMILHLAKYAGLLPALLLVEGGAAMSKTKTLSHWQVLPADDIACYMRTPLVDVIPTARAKLPLEDMENCTLISFRTRFTTGVHLALIMGNPSNSDSPLTRIHSSCVTGDILGSLRCDCGDQLHMALEQIKDAGNGLLVYLHQEGRGIGITNKLRAYQLQEQGYDTYDANLALGYDEDERDFGIAAAILAHLRVTRIRLLTNNPQKITAIEAAGIHVTERVPLIAKSGNHNHAYLEAKAKKSGHLF